VLSIRKKKWAFISTHYSTLVGFVGLIGCKEMYLTSAVVPEGNTSFVPFEPALVFRKLALLVLEYGICEKEDVNEDKAGQKPTQNKHTKRLKTTSMLRIESPSVLSMPSMPTVKLLET
jgi:hypothetical protein